MRRNLLLHLLPGAAIVIFYLIFAPVFVRLGFPRTASLLAGFLCVGMPLQIAILKRAKSIDFREPMPRWLFAALVVGLFALEIGILMLVPSVSSNLASLFSWLPSAMLPEPDVVTPSPVRSLVLITLVAQLLIDGIANPIVEEFYFRGFLLPRLGRLGWLAPVVNTALFTLGHFWQPYNYVSIFVAVLPMTLVTWWRRNIYVQMTLHCLANSIGASMALYAFFRS